MLRKPLLIAAAGVALAAPSPALAMHGRGESASRLPRNLESRGMLVAAPVAPRPFSWLDAGIGAAAMAGSLFVLAGGRRVIIRRVRLDHVS